MKKTKAVLLGVILWSLLLVSGCNFIRIEEEPRKPLEYSIVKNEDLPAELAALIQEKKANEFQLTYQSEKELFLIKGYGQQMSGGYSISVEELGVTSQAEVTQAVDTLIAKGVDCFSNLTDNNVVGVLGSILEKTNEAGIPVYGSEIEQMKLGCVAGAGLDYVQLGIQTGKMAAKILTGEATCQDLPYEVIENYSLYVNSNALAQMGITLPDDLAQEAEEVGATA